VALDPGRIGIRRSGVPIARENLYRGFAIREILTVTWARGTTRYSGGQVASHQTIGASGFGDWNSKPLTSRAAISR
jgi:hypothetical protein